MHHQDIQIITRQKEQLIGSLGEQHALLLRLKELRRQGQHDEARRLARYLELLDQSDNWSMRYGM
ncbi:MAG TPA: hypothetical protein VKT82_29335 [Ktedonobacterales bacterium]|nr:hypothetical protein [Ktedonobacterales bacterium]